MTTLETLTIRDPEFSTLAMRIDGGVRVALAGTADVRAIELLARLLPELHAHAQATAAKRVEVDFRALEFMSSSCFKTFVSWITTVQDQTAERQYRITLVSNPRVHWQRRSLYALSCFGGPLITLHTVAS